MPAGNSQLQSLQSLPGPESRAKSTSNPSGRTILRRPPLQSNGCTNGPIPNPRIPDHAKRDSAKQATIAQVTITICPEHGSRPAERHAPLPATHTPCPASHIPVPSKSAESATVTVAMRRKPVESQNNHLPPVRQEKSLARASPWSIRPYAGATPARPRPGHPRLRPIARSSIGFVP